MTPHPSFAIQLAPVPEAHVVVVCGEIEMATAADFEDAMRKALAAAAGAALLVDLTAVTFIDSKGVSALMRVLAPRRGPGRRVAVVARRPIQMMFEIAGLDRVLGVWESRADALAALAATAS
jgi:anti-sigma B factor antagonist